MTERLKRAQRAAAVSFSYEEAMEIARQSQARRTAIDGRPAAGSASTSGHADTAAARASNHLPKSESRNIGAASLADILGYDPTGGSTGIYDESKVPEKWLRYHRQLVELRNHIKEGLALHAEDTLMKSAKEDSGDLSGYSQHMADAGTDTFDRDFALSLVANEQEALAEIEAALDRIEKGTYGIDELTGKPIPRERLAAVPFARYSVESQAEMERLRKQRQARSGLIADLEDEDGGGSEKDDSEE